jgi:hypothetical protein
VLYQLPKQWQSSHVNYVHLTNTLWKKKKSGIPLSQEKQSDNASSATPNQPIITGIVGQFL